MDIDGRELVDRLLTSLDRVNQTSESLRAKMEASDSERRAEYLRVLTKLEEDRGVLRDEISSLKNEFESSRRGLEVSLATTKMDGQARMNEMALQFNQQIGALESRLVAMVDAKIKESVADRKIETRDQQSRIASMVAIGVSVLSAGFNILKELMKKQ